MSDSAILIALRTEALELREGGSLRNQRLKNLNFRGLREKTSLFCSLGPWQWRETTLSFGFILSDPCIGLGDTHLQG